MLDIGVSGTVHGALLALAETFEVEALNDSLVRLDSKKLRVAPVFEPVKWPEAEIPKGNDAGTFNAVITIS